MEVVILALLILFNGLLAMSEISVVSARRARLQALADRGNPRAKAALKLAESPTQFLSTVQIGITLIGIVAGAYGEAALSHYLQPLFNAVPALQPYSRPISISLVVLAVTYFSLVFGELVPKRIGLQNPERVALVVAGPMRWLSIITVPAVKLLSGSTDLVLRLAGVRPKREDDVTEDDVRAMLEVGAQTGVFEAGERDLVSNVFGLGDLDVGAIMTTRDQIVWLNTTEPMEVNLRKAVECGFDYLPVGKGKLDELVGILSVREWLAANLDTPTPVTAMAERPLVVPAGKSALQLLDSFRKFRIPVAIVIDEYGGVEGMVTIDDVMESIVGEINFEDAEEEPEVVDRGDGTWLVSGRMGVAKLKERFALERLAGEGRVTYNTLGGFVMTRLGHIPKEGELFEWEGLVFEVVDMDGSRVDKVLIRPSSTVPDL